ncbi:MAG TPA: DUF881 domain-containing protein [Bacillota bacterium]|mgnify:CR=1 FL=1|jgi:uncharacterized protein YlxW (UPF0749 family)|nr:DUF881 domain-containing protein [Fastidiosipila sp.]HPX92965.1 DUF881 domain-containing protein [Bacillota bacterium]HQB80779.1 DUF881 domain-containing protein [Bacillota bacterium]
MKNKWFQYISILTVCMLVGMVIALLMKNLNITNLGGQSLQELQNAIIDYQKKNEDLNNRNARLYEYLRELEAELAGGSGESYLHIVDEKEQYAAFAGLRAAKNAGVVITLTPAEGYRMQDAVIRQLVNELSALGAQAISINEERKVATTEVRTSQDLILINGVGFSRNSPFEIKAIVEPTKIDTYVVPYLLSVGDSIKKQVGDQSVAITVKKDENVLIPALREDRIAYQMELLIPAE